MLEELRVDNFKSLINVTFRPQDRNLLLGVNNAGKTTLCHVLRFLSSTTRRPLEGAAEGTTGTRFAIGNRYLKKTTTDFVLKATLPFHEDTLVFDYELTISVASPDSPAAALEVDSERLRVSGGGFDNVLLFENTRDGVRLLHEGRHLRGETAYAETSAPRDATMLNRLYDLEANARMNCFKTYLAQWTYYDFSTLALRKADHYPGHRVLMTDGSNLSSVVFQLKTANERGYRELVRCLQEVDPTIDLINFQVPSANRVFMVFEDTEGNSLPVANASNGTLRFLALLYVLLVQPETGPCPLTIIEEPENCLYVGVLKPLLDAAEQSSTRSQVIFTSHSPYFIDLFENDLNSIFVMKRGESHSSLTQPDISVVKDRLEKFPLGEMHFREML